MKRIKHLLEAFIVFMFYGICYVLPLPIASWFGGAIARAFGPLLKANTIAKNNIAMVMPEYKTNEITRVTKDMWWNLGRTIGEFPHMRKMNKKTFDRHLTCSDETLLEELLNGKERVIFYSGHLGNWEYIPKIGAIHNKRLAIVYRHANNPFVDWLINFNRHTYQARLLKKGPVGAKYLIKSIKEKCPIGILVDQKMNDGIAVPFFGRDAMTAPAIANLARRFDCLLVPVQVKRVYGTHFEYVIGTPHKVKKTDNDKDDIYQTMCIINAHIEAMIRHTPEQWFWVHRRWPKTS